MCKIKIAQSPLKCPIAHFGLDEEMGDMPSVAVYSLVSTFVAADLGIHDS